MAVPTTNDAFVYCWTNKKNKMLYVGIHKGSPEDGYVCSSNPMLEDYYSDPKSFSRQIIAVGMLKDMRKLESSILTSANAAKNPSFYNKNNNDGSFFCDGHSEETRKKMSENWKKSGNYNCDHKKAIANWFGKTHKEESKKAMREAAKKHSAKRSSKMRFDNPMKNTEIIKKMLKTRKLKKELRNVGTK
jgi:hypothetical protein